MDFGGLGNSPVADVVVDLPSAPLYITAGQNGVVAGVGQMVSGARFALLLGPRVTVTGSNTHSEIVNGGFVIVLVQVPWLTVING